MASTPQTGDYDPVDPRMTDDSERLTPEALKAEVRRVMSLVGDSASDDEEMALSAAWPDPLLAVPEKDREARVRRGTDTMIFDDPEGGTRGFVRVVLKVPLGHPSAQTYGVFVEVDRDGYAALKRAFADKSEVRVWGKLANRLPFLDDAYMSEVEVVEDGSDRRARVVAAKHEAILTGPKIGP
jgi:hypothetical protein